MEDVRIIFESVLVFIFVGLKDFLIDYRCNTNIVLDVYSSTMNYSRIDYSL